jgi:hypothetical protein
MSTTPQTDLASLIRKRGEESLARSASFNALPPDERRAIAHDTVTVLGYILGGADGRSTPASVTLSGNARAFVATGPATKRLPDTAAGFVARVDFPQFVAGLLDGVFRAIVDASVKQMEAYAALLRSVAKSVGAFLDDNVSDHEARDYLLDRYPAEEERPDPALVAAARRRIAMDRQQLLATTVLMGINRIGVTRGPFEASCRFELDAAGAPDATSDRDE